MWAGVSPGPSSLRKFYRASAFSCHFLYSSPNRQFPAYIRASALVRRLCPIRVFRALPVGRREGHSGTPFRRPRGCPSARCLLGRGGTPSVYAAPTAMTCKVVYSVLAFSLYLSAPFNLKDQIYWSRKLSRNLRWQDTFPWNNLIPYRGGAHPV